MKDGLYEILEKVAKKQPKAAKVKMLQEVAKETPLVISMLKYVFKEGIVWDLPQGAPPYKPQPKESDLQNVLYKDFRRLKIFMKGEYVGMKPHKRESLFIELLETVDCDDAKLIISMKDKKLPFKGLTKKTVCEAFPEQTTDW